eukprot:snap_masked-scaffold_22-processed-gene-4.34-mRNA-1 protein AED:1.00 eAED:1.00 QI:0/0/0/0/1/1/2/0/186
MKFQYLLGFAPMFVQGLENRIPHIENVVNALTNMIISRTRVTSTRQECNFPEPEETEDCTSDFIELIDEITKDLSDEEFVELEDITSSFVLSLEEKSDQIIAILGEPGFCTPEFLEVLPQDGFCEANEVEVAETLSRFASRFGCELVLDDVCEVFNEVTGDAVSLSAVGLGGVITLINIMVNGILN